MSNWFYAANGQQQGPFPEDRFRDLIANGTVRPDTLVWTEGMAGWQKAAEVSGLMPAGGPPPMARGESIPTMGGPGIAPGNTLSVDFGIWEFTWRSVLLLIGMIFVIPTPWVLVWYLKWIVPRIFVPRRPNLSFEGQPMSVVIWYFGFIALLIAVALIGIDWLSNLMGLVQIALYWLFLKWVIENLASNGQLLGLKFTGSVWAYIGWNILGIISVITIIGWAWVYVAWMRWAYRNIEGTRREITFVGTGLEFLWRGIVAALACLFIIPIPWVYRWMMRWIASNTALVERNAL